MSLTNGDWTDSVDKLRVHVQDHVRLLTGGATNVRLPKWTVVAHSQGGLVTRAMLGSLPSSDAVSSSLNSIFLLGTPNSGAVNFMAETGCAGYLSVNNVMRNFNGRFPTFQNKPVLAFAGTLFSIPARVAGWIWGVGRVRWDGLVIEDSVYNIYTPQGLQLTLPRIGFAYEHTQLGSPASLPILTSYIMPRLATPTVVVEGS
jgi:pimeloyl-ACP methyl ester carboxylesterase